MEEQKTCGQCQNYFKVHFNSVDLEDQAPHDEKQMMCLATDPPTLLNRFVGLMGLTENQSPFVKSCTHFEPKGKEEEEVVPEKEKEEKPEPEKNSKEEKESTPSSKEKKGIFNKKKK